MRPMRSLIVNVRFALSVLSERSVILDEVDPAIRANLESRGWLSLLEIDHPPPTALIRKFFSNLDRKSVV